MQLIKIPRKVSSVDPPWFGHLLNHLSPRCIVCRADQRRQFYLAYNQITDKSLASLLALPTAGVLPSLEKLYLYDNQITDEGCAALAYPVRIAAAGA